MAYQFATSTVNAALDALETEIGAGAIMRLYTLAPPANVAAAETGVLLAELALPADWLLAAANRVKAKSGTWQDLAANAAGVAAHFTVYAADGVTRKIQGTVSLTGGGGDMQLDNTNIAVGQVVTCTGFNINGPVA